MVPPVARATPLSVVERPRRLGGHAGRPPVRSRLRRLHGSCHRRRLAGVRRSDRRTSRRCRRGARAHSGRDRWRPCWSRPRIEWSADPNPVGLDLQRCRNGRPGTRCCDLDPARSGLLRLPCGHAWRSGRRPRSRWSGRPLGQPTSGRRNGGGIGRRGRDTRGCRGPRRRRRATRRTTWELSDHRRSAGPPRRRRRVLGADQRGPGNGSRPAPTRLGRGLAVPCRGEVMRALAPTAAAWASAGADSGS